MISRQHVVSDFFEEAEPMRRELDSAFNNTYTDKVSWHYFCDPGKYTYLRTSPHAVFPVGIFERFTQRLRQWCIENLGLVPIGTPHLHLMVNGCRLGLHSDFHNGAWGYVYSLTRWHNRKFSGGETLILRDGVPSYKKHHVHGDVLYELVPAHFNQLLIFDDRIVHATPTIEGSMDPLDGRIALVGHIRATPPLVSGSVQSTAARTVILSAMSQLRERIKSHRDVQGTVTFRVTFGTGGVVESVTTLTDNLVIQGSGYDPSDAVATVRSIIERTLWSLKLPALDGKSTVIVPVLVPLPDLRPIEYAVPHDLPRDSICRWAATHLGTGQALDLQGNWEGETFLVQEPVAGSIQIEPRNISAVFDAPMWVPSQRAHFEGALAEWVNAALAAASQ